MRTQSLTTLSTASSVLAPHERIRTEIARIVLIS
jgi:hypothetical protein